jgi:hypothetical protein
MLLNSFVPARVWQTMNGAYVHTSMSLALKELKINLFYTYADANILPFGVYEQDMTGPSCPVSVARTRR